MLVCYATSTCMLPYALLIIRCRNGTWGRRLVAVVHDYAKRRRLGRIWRCRDTIRPIGYHTRKAGREDEMASQSQKAMSHVWPINLAGMGCVGKGRALETCFVALLL